MTLPAGAGGNRFAQRLFAPLPARYDRLAEILSMGQNGRWRRAMVDQVAPAAGRTVLDVASGTAGVALQLADRTDAQIIGVDLTEQMLRQGQANVAAGDRPGRAAALSRPRLRRADLHLPAAVRAGSAGDADRACPGGQARRHSGQP